MWGFFVLVSARIKGGIEYFKIIFRRVGVLLQFYSGKQTYPLVVIFSFHKNLN